MNKRWLISLLITLVLVCVGIFGVFFIKGHMSNKLDEPSTILAEGSVVPEKDETAVEVETKEVKDIIQEAQKKVVKIELENGSIGSGFLYNDMGDIITNAHVVSGVKEVTIITSDEQRFIGTVIGISTDIDIAVVRVDGLRDIEPLKIRIEKAEIGDEILALGSPLGLDNTVTTGIISGINRDLEIEPYSYKDLYQISAPIAPGNSGGPLLHGKTGEVIGINSAASDVGTIGFSIPIMNVLSMIKGWSDAPMVDLPGVD
ncbi:S1C family serine protease [Paucisalibacillus globulus]|uniref:S1C family serine protease n=1 Tax=Paucisalibacillus globulus TaxID=351095 RepID=UPI000BB7EF56|nr:trypsin-like peptidase domain-containing protein [Paucisalibacillus globulus]